MKRFIIILNIVLTCSLTFILISYLLSPKTPKIAYVRTAFLIEQYSGMEEAKVAYQQKLNNWQASLDTLSSGLNTLMQNYEQKAASMPVNEVKDLENSINLQHNKLENYQLTVEEKALKAEENYMQGIMNQINSYVKRYAEKNGYDIILGTTQYGSLMYGKDGLDITDQILEGLNKEYKQ